MLAVEWQRRGRCTESKAHAAIVSTLDTLASIEDEEDMTKSPGNLESSEKLSWTNLGKSESGQRDK